VPYAAYNYICRDSLVNGVWGLMPTLLNRNLLFTTKMCMTSAKIIDYMLAALLHIVDCLGRDRLKCPLGWTVNGQVWKSVHFRVQYGLSYCVWPYRNFNSSYVLLKYNIERSNHHFANYLKHSCSVRSKRFLSWRKKSRFLTIFILWTIFSLFIIIIYFWILYSMVWI